MVRGGELFRHQGALARSRLSPAAGVVTLAAAMDGDRSPHGAVLILGAALLWGTTGTAQALAPEGATPISVGSVRMAVGGLGLLAVAALGRRRVTPLRDQVPWWLVAAAGVAAYQLFFFAGVARAGVALGTVVAIGSAPILAGALAAWVEQERPGARWMLATALAVLGVVAIGGGVGDGDLAGVLLALGAGASYAVYAVGSKRLVAAMAPLGAMALVFATAGVVLAPVALLTDLAWLTEPAGWRVALWLGLAATTSAYVLFGYGLRLIPVSTTATLSLAEPLTATLLGVLLLGERPGVVAWIGVAAVAAGLVLVSLPRPWAGR